MMMEMGKTGVDLFYICVFCFIFLLFWSHRIFVFASNDYYEKHNMFQQSLQLTE